MKNIIILFLISLLFIGCSSASLGLDKQDNLNLKYDDKNHLLTKDIVREEFLDFKDLSIQQYRGIVKGESIIFYEKAWTDMSFEFNFNGLPTVMYIFDDSRKYEKVYVRNNLTLVQIQLKDKNYVNVIIQDNNTQTYAYAYGFSNEEFLKIAELIKLEDTEIVVPKYQAVTFDLNSKPQTSWNPLLIYFTPLITPLRELRSF